MKKIILLAIMAAALLTFWTTHRHQSPSTPVILPADQVFQVAAKITSESNIQLIFTIAPNFYIYKQSLVISASPADAINLKPVIWPHTLLVPDINDQNISEEVYIGSFRINIPLDSRVKNPALHVTLQGCDGKSICYPAQTFELLGSKTIVMPGAMNTYLDKFSQLYYGEITGSALLGSLNLIELAGIFFLAGIAIALTPCMYPLYPIALSSIIGNANRGRKNIFILVLLYIHGLALIYVLMGFIAAITGALFTNIIQTPLVMYISGAMWFVLGLAMFDIIEIRLPSKLNSYLHGLKFGGNSYIRVFLMGILSSIVLGPCVTPALIAAIGFIVGRANILFGGIGLYAISLGMGVPILILALIGGNLLPRSGRWMVMVKYAMGAIMIGFSGYLVYQGIGLAAHKPVQQAALPGKQETDNVRELDRLIRMSDKPVIIDFYASWCSICKEMAATTLKDKDLQQLLAGYTFITFDVTRHDTEQLDVLRRYGLYGPPALVVIAKNKQVADKILGFVTARELIRRLTTKP